MSAKPVRILDRDLEARIFALAEEDDSTPSKVVTELIREALAKLNAPPPISAGEVAAERVSSGQSVFEDGTHKALREECARSAAMVLALTEEREQLRVEVHNLNKRLLDAEYKAPEGFSLVKTERLDELIALERAQAGAHLDPGDYRPETHDPLLIARWFDGPDAQAAVADFLAKEDMAVRDVLACAVRGDEENACGMAAGRVLVFFDEERHLFLRDAGEDLVDRLRGLAEVARRDAEEYAVDRLDRATRDDAAVVEVSEKEREVLERRFGEHESLDDLVSAMLSNLHDSDGLEEVLSAEVGDVVARRFTHAALASGYEVSEVLEQVCDEYAKSRGR